MIGTLVRVGHAYRGGVRAFVRWSVRWAVAGARSRSRRVAVAWSLAAVALLGACDRDAWGATWVGSGSRVVVDGETVKGVLWVAGGDVRLAPGSAVTGPVVVAGGSLVVDGYLAGPLVHVAGDVRLGPWAAVHGRLLSAAPIVLDPDALLRSPAVRVPGVPWAGVHPLLRAFAWALAGAVAAALWALVRPAGLDAMADALVRRPWATAITGAAMALAVAAAAWALATWAGAAAAAGVVLALGVAAALTGWAAVGHAWTRALRRGPWPGWPGWAGRRLPLAVVGGFDTGLAVGLVAAIPAVGAPLALLVTLATAGAVVSALPSLRRRRIR